MKGLRVLDADGDGTIEVAAMVRSLRAIGYGKAQPRVRGGRGAAGPFERFETLDEDGDGLLRGDEPGPYMRGHEAFQDGEITFEEYRAAWAELQGRRGNRGGGRGGGGQSRGSGRARGSGSGEMSPSDLQFLSSLDANRDRILSAEEVRRAVALDVAEAMESRTGLDANSDGAVSAREYALSQPKTGRPVDKDGLDGHGRGHFEREDLNHDGALSVTEIAKRVYSTKIRRIHAMQLGLRLELADVNSDGQLDSGELRSVGGDTAVTALLGTDLGTVALAAIYGRLYATSPDRAAAIDRAPGLSSKDR